MFIGFLFIVMGLGDDNSGFLSNDLKIISGLIILCYGLYFYYKTDNKTTTKSDIIKHKIKPITHEKKIINKILKKGYSYVYLVIGCLLLKLPEILYSENPYKMDLTKIVIYIVGFILVICGLYLFFKEKKEK